MAEMTGLLVGPDVRAVEMSLDYTEAVYLLACLGTSNTTLFPSLNGSTRSLYDELALTLGIESPDVPDAEANEATRLYRRIIDVLEVWSGRTNYAKARKRSAHLGL